MIFSEFGTQVLTISWVCEFEIYGILLIWILVNLEVLYFGYLWKLLNLKHGN